ncbi:hypothetical protein NQ318_011637 [Aromia moschata]|uniref:Nuclear pore complex protein Nup160 homolog n=1 Tax=Aromia moschata TaxID=1265417 RepID=A0AAV8Z8Z0_9CUCU|nr:hypothetical protein NQ318_011637 [Aromia moschata]
MTEFTLSYREVIPDQASSENWKEITLSTGGTQSTLQDIKVAERANGFCYEDSTKYHTRNRFIYWRINYDILELVEYSLDVNLTGNRIRYKFKDTPILDGISIHETMENIIVLVPTVCSVHRLIFSHPDKFHRQDKLLGTHPDLAAPSIFSRATGLEARNPSTFHVFSGPSTASDDLPTLACSYFLPETEEAIFVLAYSSNELLLLKQSPNGQTVSSELKGESLMPRFLSGLAEKFRQRNSDAENIVSLLILVVDFETYVLTLSRDGHLKFWSCTKGQCVAVIDILAETGDVVKDRVQGAILRKAVDENGSESIIAVYMSFTTGSRFYILKPVISGQQIRIVRLNTLYPSENDLIDFAIQTNRLWSAWRSEDGECVVYTASYKSNNWTRVILETLPDEDPLNMSDMDEHYEPRQFYLDYIFHPGRFPLSVISKALSIYKRQSIIADSHLTASGLRQRVCIAMENEIRDALIRPMVCEDDYLNCTEWCWQKFVGAVFLRKMSFSFLRPMDPLEHMTLCSDNMYRDQFINFSMLAEDMDTTGDVMDLFEIIVYLEQQMSEKFLRVFDKELYNLQAPDVVMANLLERIQSEMDSQFSDQVITMVNKITDLYKAMHKVLELLRYENTLANPDNEINPSALYQFSSQLGVSLVAGCLRQQAQTRFQICRNLLLICNILLNSKNSEWGVLEAIRSVCSPEIVVLTQASFGMLWLSGLTALVNLPQESSMQRLTPIKLSPVFNLRTTNSCAGLLELFISSTGGDEARKSFARVKCSDEALAHWHLSLLPFLNHMRHIIWPISGGTVLAEWLLSSGQHLWLQQYVRLLSNWCEWNSCTRSFLLAASFLTTGENYKAQELFQEAAKGIFSDQFLEQRILKGVEENPMKAYTNYYLKVIQLFELHKARDCAISVANTALSIVEPDDPLAIKRGPLSHRLAASVMYEQGFRLLHLSTPEALEKQVKCFLAAKSVLQLCNPDYAWVVRPTDTEDEEEIAFEPLAGSGKDLEVFKLQKQVEVVNINAIKRDLLFASAKLKLVRFDSTSPVNVTTPIELVTLLNSAGLFKTALEICTNFNLSYNSVFETLTKHSVLLTEEDHPGAWNWLAENDLQDLPVNRDSAADVVWQLLQECLEKYEKPNMTVLHNVICKKIINMKANIPIWLLASYKVRNAAELLRLLHSSGRLAEAVELANDYLLAAMGYGKEFYGFDRPLAPTAPAFCLPVYAIQNLINELDVQNSKSIEKPYNKEYNNLKDLFTKYLATATRISNELFSV